MENSQIFSVVLSGRAEKELINSFDWYEQQQQGLGDRFTSEVLHWISKIEQNPMLFSFKHKSYREAVITTFPFLSSTG